MWTLWVLLGVYAGTSALGTGIRLRLIDTSGFRWVHHALFGLIWLTLAASIFWSFSTALPGRWLLLILVPCMALLPRFRAGSASHCLAAVGGLVVLIGIIVWALVGPMTLDM